MIARFGFANSISAVKVAVHRLLHRLVDITTRLDKPVSGISSACVTRRSNLYWAAVNVRFWRYSYTFYSP